ncbi:MAG: CoA transferase [Gammaproteobacteria bacterium]|nr:CoA transferase [Gammaproteobacteria bacterium]
MTALDGMRVLDMTQFEAGTCCTQSLAFLGADVVKVERPNVGDPGRGRARGESIDAEYFINWNSNKRSVTLDLSNPEGRDLLLKMVRNYDVFVENYGPGVVEKLDIGYDVMRRENPQLIYARIKGFGTSGPRADYKCMDMVAQAAAGAMSITGNPDGPPMRPGPTTGDAGTGMQAALAITAAYVQRLRTGEGQVIELAMQEAMTYYLRTAVSRTRFGTVPSRRSANGENPFMAMYPCSPGGPNDYVYIMAVNQRMWDAVAAAIGMPELMRDERFSNPRTRHENRQALFDTIATWTRTKTKQEASTVFSEAGVCASPVNETTELFTDEHLLERDFIKQLDHREHGQVRILGWPSRLSKSSVEPIAAPLLGEHTDEVLQEDLGLSTEQLVDLHRRNVVGNEELERTEIDRAAS